MSSALSADEPLSLGRGEEGEGRGLETGSGQSGGAMATGFGVKPSAVLKAAGD